MEIAMKYIVKILNALVITVGALTLLYAFTRICLCDRFIVRGESMLPSFEDGRSVYVNKLIFGGRIYKNTDWDSSQLSTFRLPGLRNIKVGDVVMMNYPYAQCNDSINFKLNYVYMKRCFGVPGDTVRIKNGYYIHPDSKENIDLGYYTYRLSNTPDSILTEMGVVVKAFQLNKRMEWSIREFGPLYVPKTGDQIEITPVNLKTYRKMIHYETGIWPQIKGDVITLAGEVLESYQFQTNWYFLGGDNVLNSRDSRYFGLVPEEYIIGVVHTNRRKHI